MPHVVLPTDEELLDRARRGDQYAFKLLVERYEGKVAATVISMLGRGPEADDVGQETFIRFFKSLDSFRGEASLGTYLTRIAINQSLKAIKRKQTWTQRFFSRDEGGENLYEPVADENEPMEEQERSELVQQALQLLNPDHRAVVILRLLEGYSTKETAAILQLPEGTIMSRLSRALAKLEKILGPIL